MSLLQQIKQDQLQARKSKDSDAVSLLTTLIGEASMPGKNDGNRESTDSEVQAVIKKFLKNANETMKHLLTPGFHSGSPGADAVMALKYEIDILESYMPKQLTEQELRACINDHIAFAELKGMQSMGKVMGFLKQNYDGQYDGKMASNIVKELLK